MLISNLSRVDEMIASAKRERTASEDYTATFRFFDFYGPGDYSKVLAFRNVKFSLK